MRILLIRPEDTLLAGPWTDFFWDRAIDLGHAGRDAYLEAGSRLACSIESFDDFRDRFEEFHRIRDLLALGLGKVGDRFGLDWWELTASEIHSQLDAVVLLSKLTKTIRTKDEVHISGPGFHADVLNLLLENPITVFEGRTGYRLSRYVRAAWKFPLWQLLQIFWDKTDPGYRIRGFFAPTPKLQDSPVILVPTAYINASRTGMAYAKTLPDAHFLLVATRRSGWVADRPPNMSAAWLQSYASVRMHTRGVEHRDLVSQWTSLRKELENAQEFMILSKLGGFDNFPSAFARGLEIRDAWRRVLYSEPVSAVLCTDDSNSHTHIPLLLAKQKGLPTISCHHGALDGSYMLKRCHADAILAKGVLEKDYLVHSCRVPEEKVIVGAPRGPSSLGQRQQGGKKRSIVFFSEPYEVRGGRAADVYRDLLPRLCNVARTEGRRLVIKLHPFESVREREKIVDRILSVPQRRSLYVIDGPLGELLDETWFGITVLSTVAMECTLREIPCFLCKWLEWSAYGYIDQFTRFGVGMQLDNPEEILSIPAKLGAAQLSWRPPDRFWQPITAERLSSLLGMSPNLATPSSSVPERIGEHP